MHDDSAAVHRSAAAAGPRPGMPVPGPRPAVPRPGADQDVTRGGPPDLPSDGSTGDDAVDEALSRLAGLADLPVRDHVAVLDAVHAALQDRLADVED